MSSWRFFIKVHVAQSLVFCIVFCRPLSLCIVFFGRCIVCLLSLLITHLVSSNFLKGPSWSWSYGSWIYNYLCNQCLSLLMLWVRISIRARWTTLCDKVCQWVATGRWFSPGPPVSSTNETGRHDITEILLKMALNIIKQTNKSHWVLVYWSFLFQFLCYFANITFTNQIIVFLILKRQRGHCGVVSIWWKRRPYVLFNLAISYKIPMQVLCSFWPICIKAKQSNVYILQLYVRLCVVCIGF